MRFASRVAVLAVAMALAPLVGPDDSFASGFAPAGIFRLCAFTGGDLQNDCSGENRSVSANADASFKLTVNSGDSVMGGATLFAAPSSVVFAGLPLGAVVGKLSSSLTVAFANNPCNTSLPPQTVVLMNASTNNAKFNEIDSAPLTASGTEGTLEMFRDDGNTNGLPQHVERYPAYLNRMFDPDRVGDINGDGDDYDVVNQVVENPGASDQDAYGVIDPLVPLARYSGSVKDATTGLAIVAQVVVFSPSALSVFQPPSPFADMSSTLGYPALLVLQDPTGSAGPGGVSDSCSPMETRILLWGRTRDNPCTGAICTNDDTPCVVTCGDNSTINSLPALVDSGSPVTCSGTNERGCARYANPSSAGTHLFYVYQQSQRDGDNDGKENTLDTCPLTYDTLDARTGAGPDTDFDLIANACDTNGDGNIDSDLDGFKNTQDNCPQNSNADQKESETITPHATAAKRGGSRADGIGDVCDPNPTKADVHFHTVFTVIPKCIGATDADGDGWCSTGSTGVPADPNDNNAGRTPEDYDIFVPLAVTHSGSGAAPPEREPRQVCNDGIDNDGDTLIDILDQAAGSSTCRPKGVTAHPGYPACPNGPSQFGCPGIDTDGDGFTDEVEIHVGTDALGRCEVGAVPAQSTDWPSDFVSGGIPNSTDKVNVTDLTSFLAPARRLDTSPGNANFNVRWDLVPGPGLFANWIVVNDLTSLIAGTTGFPPMFNGAKAFGRAAACTAHPTYGD